VKLLTKELEKRFATVGSQEGKGDDTLIIAKYFTPDSNWTWYATEYDADTLTFFGLVHGFEKEWGYFSLAEMAEAKGPLGLGIERDLYFDRKQAESLWQAMEKANDPWADLERTKEVEA
jgi:hypothetical protein